MFDVRVTITKSSPDGKTPAEWVSENVNKLTHDIQAIILEVSDAAALEMKSILLNSGYKLDKLADEMKADFPETFGEMYGGIGKISDLPVGKDGNYYCWAFNSGFTPPPNWGYFTSGSGLSGDKTPPISGMKGQKWVHTGNKDTHGHYYMIPEKDVVKPLKYIDIGYDYLKNHISREIDRLFQELK